MKYRLAFDMGETSIGWAIFKLDREKGVGRYTPCELIDSGVRLYDNGLTTTRVPNGAARRLPRSARRMRDRFLQRQSYLQKVLCAYGLLPPPGEVRDALMSQDPYPLRSSACEREITLHEIGRVLFHLNKHRGFKSNRKTDNASGDDEDTGLISKASQALENTLQEEGFKTLGQFYAARQSARKVRDRKSVRVRKSAVDNKELYEYFPTRAMVEHEFDCIMQEQSTHHREVLSEGVTAKLRKVIFFQRPLKPVVVGRCSFLPEESRCPRANEHAQAFILLQKLNHIRFGEDDTPLDRETRDRLFDHLMAGKDLTWRQFRSLAMLDKGARINFEEGGEKKLLGNPIAQRLQGTQKNPGPLFHHWEKMDAQARQALITAINQCESDEELFEWASQTLEFDEDTAHALTKTRLPDGHVSICEKVCIALVEKLKEEVITYDEACRRAQYSSSAITHTQSFNRLPPYNQISALQRHIGFGTGDPKDPPDVRFGKVTNPTVHIALNQLRRIVNELIDSHGKPTQVVLEVARELKQSEQKRTERTRENRRNQDENNRRRALLEEHNQIAPGERKIRDKLLKIRLWEELGPEHKCPYTAKPISKADLFSDRVEVEHILPFSLTIDNSPANLTVAFRYANQLKHTLTPAEAADHHPNVFNKAEMQALAKRYPKNKSWRFQDDARTRYDSEEGWLDRQLHSTAYACRLAKAYLEALFPVDQTSEKKRQHVWVIPGQLTAFLRYRWGLSANGSGLKSREDQRHHAIDAIIVGVTDRRLLQRISTENQKRGGLASTLVVPEPYSGFREEVMRSMLSLENSISWRAKHGHLDPSDPYKSSCKFHEDDSYGGIRPIPENADDLDIGNLVKRKPVHGLSLNELSKVRDKVLREELLEIGQTVKRNTEGQNESAFKKELGIQLAAWSKKTNIRRVRILVQKANAVPINSKKQKFPYRLVIPNEVLWMDVYETANGDWTHITVDSFSGHKGEPPDIPVDASFIMRLRKGDTLQLFDEDGTNSVKRILRLEPSANRIRLACVKEGGELDKRHKAASDPFRWDFATISKLKARRPRRVRFTVTGRMKAVPHGKL